MNAGGFVVVVSSLAQSVISILISILNDDFYSKFHNQGLWVEMTLEDTEWLHGLSLHAFHTCSDNHILKPVLQLDRPHLGSYNFHWEGENWAGLQAREAENLPTLQQGLFEKKKKNEVWLCNWLLICAKIFFPTSPMPRFLTLRKPEFEFPTQNMFKNNHRNRCANVPFFLSWGLGFSTIIWNIILETKTLLFFHNSKTSFVKLCFSQSNMPTRLLPATSTLLG